MLSKRIRSENIALGRMERKEKFSHCSILLKVKGIPSPPITAIAGATPPTRDRVIDGLRAVSLSVVVFGHCFMALVLWRQGVPSLGNSLTLHRPMQLFTWVVQVMPLFFFAGGASNAITWRAKRNSGYSTWLWGRAARLLRPLWVYLIVMAPVALIVAHFGPTDVTAPLLLLTTQLLWFLGAYLIVTALGPVFWTLHQRRPFFTIASLAAIAVLVDIARFGLGGPTALGLINFVVVWCFAAQLGVWYVERRPQPRSAALVAFAGLLVNARVVKLAHYPLSMVGMPGEKVSNMAPPTVPLMVHSVVVCMLAMCLITPLQKFFARDRAWRYAVLINTVAMTLYLWHLPMLILLVVIERATGLGGHVTVSHGVITAGTHYWFWWPLHFSVFIVMVSLVVRIFWVLENTPLPLWDAASRFPRLTPRLSGFAIGVGVTLCGISLLMFSATGLGGFPTRVIHYAGLPLSSGLALLVLIVGATAIRLAGAPRR